MVEVVPFDERIARLDTVTRSSPVAEDFGLVKILTVTEIQRARLRAALNGFLWSCLVAAFPEKAFALSDDMLAAYETDIIRLPNVTPNGLILPKRENILSFNVLQKEAVTAFAELGIGPMVARAQFPVNIRLQSGTPDAKVDSRPRASVKPHTDIWAGDPASGILAFLSVLGDPKKAGIDFFAPESFPYSFVRPLADYDEGRELFDNAQKVASFDEQGWFLVDPYVIHRTTKKAPGYRISLDFRIIPKQQAPADSDEEDIRKPYFISFAQWATLGSKTLLMTEETMGGFMPSNNKDPYTIGYPVKFSLLDIERADTTWQQRKAG